MRIPSSALCLAVLAAFGSPTSARAELELITVFPYNGISLPAPSPDGEKIAFTWSVGGMRGSDIYLLDFADTTRSAIQLTDTLGRDAKPSWSPSGGEFAFMSARSGDEDIWVYSFTTASARQLTFSREGSGIRAQEFWPAWSPDGSRIAFSSDRSGDDDIWWVSAEGGEPVRVTKRNLPRARDEERYPEWAPDGKRLTFSSRTSGNWDIWITTADDTALAPIQVTSDSTNEWGARWSPNGKWLVFVSDRTGNLDLFVVPAAGGDPIQLTKNPSMDSDPCWSADGRRIYYSGHRDEQGGLWGIGRLEEVLGPGYADPAPVVKADGAGKAPSPKRTR